MAYRSIKTYGHEVGLSCAFRQWRAASHCHLIHGYALAFRIEFESETLDQNNWVIDFGALKSFKKEIELAFDHTLAVALDDPLMDNFLQLDDLGLANVRVFEDGVGCEKFAWHVWGLANKWLRDNGHKPRVRVASVECREHGANAASFIAEDYT